jgi:hypothetical protein
MAALAILQNLVVPFSFVLAVKLASNAKRTCASYTRSKSSSRPSSWLYREFLTLIQ